MNEIGRYEYYAFISCVPEDEKFAKWLRKNLESFSLSAYVQNDNQMISDKIDHFLLNKKDVNFGKNEAMISAELVVSKYLLVVCTPAAAQSKNINEGIRVFFANGRKDNVILLMVGGEPDASDPQNECLPVDIQELPKDERPILWDFRTAERNKTITSLIAYLKQVPVTSLLQYNKNNKISWRTILYSLVSILILVGGLLWEYNRVRYEYYVTYVDRWGIPEGIDPLTPEQVSVCGRSLRFEYRHIPISEGNPIEWRLDCVSCMNGYGQLETPQRMAYLPRELDCSVCKLDYYQGKIYSISYYDANDQLVSTCNLLDYEGEPQGWIDRRFHQGASGNIVEDGSSTISRLLQIPCIKIERDSDGYIQRFSYHANNDRDIRRSAVCDGFYSFGYAIYRDKKHRLVKMVALDKDMKPIENRHGVMSVNNVYDEITGYIAEMSYHDKSGNLIEDLTLMSRRYDERRNLIEISYYDKSGAPCIDYESGVFVRHYIRDEHGAVIERCFFDQASNPMNSKQGYARACYKRDSRGNILDLRFYDEKDNLTLTDGGYAVYKCKYNKDCKIIETSFYGVDEKPILNHKGYACIRFTYDDQNRTVSESYFDETDMPIEADKVHGAQVEYVYGNEGLVASESYYDVNGQPYVGQHGMKTVYKYDDRGNVVEKTFYDDQGNLFVGVDKVAQFRYWYDDLGLQTEARCYGTDGELTMHRKNFSIFRSEYDSLNRIINYAFFDRENRPSACYFLQCAMAHQINETYQNRIITTIKYNWDGNNYIEMSRSKIHNDIHGNTILTQYLDSKGQCRLNKDGVASWTLKHDQRGNSIECNYWGIDGNPVSLKGYNFASWKARYDHKDRRIEQSYYDIHGNLTESNRGVARWKAVYKDDENTPYMYYYDLAGNVISNDEK